jgi:hypothetical protein
MAADRLWVHSTADLSAAGFAPAEESGGWELVLTGFQA